MASTFFWQAANQNSNKRGVALEVKAWRGRCRELLRRMIASPDSQPFRQPVDLFEYPVKHLRTDLIYNFRNQGIKKGSEPFYFNFF